MLVLASQCKGMCCCVGGGDTKLVTRIMDSFPVRMGMGLVFELVDVPSDGGMD